MAAAEPRPSASAVTGGNATPERRRTRHWVMAAVVVGLCLRLAFALFYWVDRPMTRDELEYLSLARSVTAGQGFAYDAEILAGPVEPFGRAPGYPLFLALVGGGLEVTRAVPASVKVAQSIVGALGIVMIAALAWRLGGDQAARAGAVLAAGYPPLVWISAYAFSEALFWPMGLLVAWTLDRAVFSRSRPGAAAVAVGLLTGAAVLVRPGLLLFVPLAGLWLVATRRHVVTVGLALGFVLVLAPWTVRNHAHYGRWVLVASEGGITFWTGNHPLAIGDGDMAANQQLKRADEALRARYPNLTQEEIAPVYYREALAWMRAEPLDWLVLEARKVFYLVVPIGPSYTLHSTRYFVASVVSYGALLPLAVVGFVRAGRARRQTPGLWLLALSAVAASLIFFPQERYRLPIIDPALIVCAAAFWTAKSEAART